jgi:hypothetical protein
MKKTRRQGEEHAVSAPPREPVHVEREAEGSRSHPSNADGDLMWGDEGIDDPPAQS